MIHDNLMYELMQDVSWITTVSTGPPHVCGLSPLLFHPVHQQMHLKPPVCQALKSADDTTLTGGVCRGKDRWINEGLSAC